MSGINTFGKKQCSKQGNQMRTWSVSVVNIQNKKNALLRSIKTISCHDELRK